MRIPVNTQHPACGYENAVACLNTNVLKDSTEWLSSNCTQTIRRSELVL